MPMTLTIAPMTRDDEHRPARDLGRGLEPLERLEQDVRGDPEQQTGVDDRGQDLEAQVAERPLAAGRP